MKVNFIDVLINTEVIDDTAKYQSLKDKNLVDLYNQSKRKSGHPAQWMTILDDGYKVLFRDDREEKVHPLPVEKYKRQNVKYFNIEV